MTASVPLTQRQIRILLVGHSAGATGRGFLNKDEEYQAWSRYRLTFLKSSGSPRPAAYLKFELCEQTPRWISETEQLFRTGFLSAATIADLERTCETLSPEQPLELHAEFESSANIRGLNRSLSDLEVLVREFGHAQAWHVYRGRPELASKYSRIGAALREVLRESLTVLRFQHEEN